MSANSNGNGNLLVGPMIQAGTPLGISVGGSLNSVQSSAPTYRSMAFDLFQPVRDIQQIMADNGLATMVDAADMMLACVEILREDRKSMLIEMENLRGRLKSFMEKNHELQMEVQDLQMEISKLKGGVQ